MGSLLGIVHSSYIEITNCYSVPEKQQKEDQKQYLDTNYHNIMFNHNSSVYPQESLLGGFVTESERLESDLINLSNFYSQKEVGFVTQPGLVSPLILSIDPKLKNNNFNLKVLSYDKQLDLCQFCGILPFKNISVNVEFSEEKLNEENVQQLLKELDQNLIVIQKKVQDIVNRNAESDENLGKQIKRLLNFIPNLGQQEYQKSLEKTNQDVLLVQVLSNLAKTQTLITEKLNQVSINV
ncbi:mov34 mpn pad-1 family protein, putative [Ichthyophthirius multifiliis]|uniref:Mov34 mpn pad-1 family protein, putative n=1 Tax=Ichthyophthirius multifiliis TaxID=5932 RepID=G0QV76_ICHMU|nr:mov34 mpn pad-1 family protein, putative [Ichthyophthirius multifiliis]EGR30877.1 mov34 mpn pad-1 family protein, putative [Ichthyophthirius multifiliis]|eukprot:XP_004032464.1 mov34 mpn pad-1 family protein, putative [Ichthyophthirius multifiliis]